MGCASSLHEATTIPSNSSAQQWHSVPQAGRNCRSHSRSHHIWRAGKYDPLRGSHTDAPLSIESVESQLGIGLEGLGARYVESICHQLGVRPPHRRFFARLLHGGATAKLQFFQARLGGILGTSAAFLHASTQFLESGRDALDLGGVVFRALFS